MSTVVLREIVVSEGEKSLPVCIPSQCLAQRHPEGSFMMQKRPLYFPGCGGGLKCLQFADIISCPVQGLLSSPVEILHGFIQFNFTAVTQVVVFLDPASRPTSFWKNIFDLQPIRAVHLIHEASRWQCHTLAL